jgi:diguanylate cyclase (GGDEF)-like protein
MVMRPSFLKVAPWWTRADARDYYWKLSTPPRHFGILVALTLLTTIIGTALLISCPTPAINSFGNPILEDIVIADVIVILILCDRALTRNKMAWEFNLTAIPLAFAALFLPRLDLTVVVLTSLTVGGFLARFSPWRLVFQAGSWIFLMGYLAWVERTSISHHGVFSFEAIIVILLLSLLSNFLLTGIKVSGEWVSGGTIKLKQLRLSTSIFIFMLVVAGATLGWMALAMSHRDQEWWYVSALIFVVLIAWRNNNNNRIHGVVQSAYEVISIWRDAHNPNELVDQCLQTWQSEWDCEEVRCYLVTPGRHGHIDEYICARTGDTTHVVHPLLRDPRDQPYGLARNEGKARILSPRDTEPFVSALGWIEALDLPLDHGDQFIGRLVVIRKNYDHIPWRDEDISAWLPVQQLFSAAVSASRTSSDLEWLALHDSLTKLPNSTLFNQILESSLRDGTHPGLLFLDVNHFKQINDTLGHEVGDRVLGIVGGRLRNHVKADDVVARLHGDEFVVLLMDITNREQAMAVAERIRGDISQPTNLPAPANTINVSIGGLINISENATTIDILRKASYAMYGCKHGDGVTPNVVEYTKASSALELSQSSDRDDSSLRD